jgi:hypothetical protein
MATIATIAPYDEIETAARKEARDAVSSLWYVFLSVHFINPLTITIDL